MKILVINSGSSTIKYALFDSENQFRVLLKGKVARIGEAESTLKHQEGGQSQLFSLPMPDQATAMNAVFDRLDTSLIDAVGHRIVHGCDALSEPVLIDAKVVEQIKEAGRFVPLHCAPNVIGIEVAQKRVPCIPQAAIFDTAAYVHLPEKAYLYAIPRELYDKYKVRRYGFHGINHSYVAAEAAKYLGNDSLKLISCHLGSGCSITAFESGQPIDTSMGLTPLEGLVMGSRSGDLDPAAVLYLMEALHLNTREIDDLLNKKSGLLGLCGKNDMRDIETLVEKGEKQAQITIDLFVYRIQKYIGAYIAALKGIDAIVFTGGIGENDPFIREKVVSQFHYMGVEIDRDKNQRQQLVFSAESSKVSLLTIPANEELVIAKQTAALI